jgi:hypothetical protein
MINDRFYIIILDNMSGIKVDKKSACNFWTTRTPTLFGTYKSAYNFKKKYVDKWLNHIKIDKHSYIFRMDLKNSNFKNNKPEIKT